MLESAPAACFLRRLPRPGVDRLLGERGISGDGVRGAQRVFKAVEVLLSDRDEESLNQVDDPAAPGWGAAAGLRELSY